MKRKELKISETTIENLERTLQNTRAELEAEGHKIISVMKIPYYNGGKFDGTITYMDVNDA